jgi:hypothetical protein
MTARLASGLEWPVRCDGAPGGVRVSQSLAHDPQAPAWRISTEWCAPTRRLRPPRTLRHITAAEIADACPALEGRLW